MNKIQPSVAGKIPRHFVFPLRNFQDILAELEGKLDQHPIIEITGFPLRVYVSKEPEFASAVFGHPTIGITKFPAIMPRIQTVMKNKGTFIFEGGEEWKSHRSAVQTIFKPENFDNILSELHGIVQKYLTKWSLRSEQNQPFDIFPDLRDLFCELNFRMLFDYPLDAEQLRKAEAATLWIDLKFISPIPLALPTPANFKFKKAVQTMYSTFDQAIERRKAKGITPGCKDLLGHLLAQSWERDRVIGEMASIYFGASIMSTTMAWALSLVGSHPEVEEKLAAESAGYDSSSRQYQDKLANCPYARALMKESLRFFPSSWGFPRYSRQDLEILGYALPKNSLLIPLILLTQRDARFWEEPLKFKPERFLQMKAEFNKYAYLPFGSGPRTCLGAGLSSILLPTFLLMLSKQFRIKFVPRYPGDPLPDYGFEIHPKDQVQILLKSR